MCDNPPCVRGVAGLTVPADSHSESFEPGFEISSALRFVAASGGIVPLGVGVRDAMSFSDAVEVGA
jgi:hypothetical protein